MVPAVLGGEFLPISGVLDGRPTWGKFEFREAEDVRWHSGLILWLVFDDLIGSPV